MMRDFTPRTLPANRPSLFLGLGLLLCLTVLSVEAGYGQDQQAPSKRRFLRWSYQDAADWVESTDRKRLLQTAGFVAALAPLSLLDGDAGGAPQQRVRPARASRVPGCGWLRVWGRSGWLRP